MLDPALPRCYQRPMSNALSLRPGDRLPDFALAGLDGKLRKLIWSFTGEPVALVAIDDLRNLDGEQFTAFLARCRDPPTVAVVPCGNPLPPAPPSRANLAAQP